MTRRRHGIDFISRPATSGFADPFVAPAVIHAAARCHRSDLAWIVAPPHLKILVATRAGVQGADIDLRLHITPLQHDTGHEPAANTQRAAAGYPAWLRSDNAL